MFSKHLCSYIALLLYDWSIPMLTICCFSWSDSNELFIMTHCCSNDSISRIKSITSINVHDLERCSVWSDFP